MQRRGPLDLLLPARVHEPPVVARVADRVQYAEAHVPREVFLRDGDGLGRHPARGPHIVHIYTPTPIRVFFTPSAISTAPTPDPGTSMKLLCSGAPVPVPVCVEQCTPEWLRGACRRTLLRTAPVLCSIRGSGGVDGCLSVAWDDEAALHVPPSSADFVLELFAHNHASTFDPPSDTDWDPPADEDDNA